jgi:hypothetical protein
MLTNVELFPFQFSSRLSFVVPFFFILFSFLILLGVPMLSFKEEITHIQLCWPNTINLARQVSRIAGSTP